MQEYINSDSQIHWLSQIITKINRAYVPEKKDDSHTNLYFDAISNRLYGRWIDSSKGKLIIAINLKTKNFEWIDNKLSVLNSVSFINKDLTFIEKEISKYPDSIGMDASKIIKPLHFEIPDYKILRIKEEDLSTQRLKVWEYYRELANKACLSMLAYLQAEGEIRIWPHHFDTGTYAQITDLLGIGFGLAIKDAMVGEPYFYLYGYNSQSLIKYENMNKLSIGKWIVGEQWNGAVLPLSKLSEFSYENALDNIKQYMRESIDWFLIQ